MSLVTMQKIVYNGGKKNSEFCAIYINRFQHETKKTKAYNEHNTVNLKQEKKKRV